MGKTFHPYFVGQNAAKKVFRPWYRPGSEASRSGEAAADDAATDDADPDQSAVVVRPLETLDLAASGTPGEKVFRSVTLAEMRARRNNVRSVTREEIMRPREVRPWFRPGDPRAVEVKWRRKSADDFYTEAYSEEISVPAGIEHRQAPDPAGIRHRRIFLKPYDEEPLSSYRRGTDYPHWYYGFLRPTYIKIWIDREDDNSRIDMEFGPTRRGNSAELKNLEFQADTASTKMLKATFFNSRHEMPPHVEIWNEKLDTDFHDRIRIKVQNGKKLRFRRVVLVLNNVVVLDKQYNGTAVNEFDLTEAIRVSRIRKVGNTDNPILSLAARQIGKSWDPRYGGTWNFPGGKPNDWCSEFAAWVIRNATSLQVPRNKNGLTTWGLARYFCGLTRDTDLNYYYTRKNNGNRFITPNQIMMLKDDNEAFCIEYGTDREKMDLNDLTPGYLYNIDDSIYYNIILAQRHHYTGNQLYDLGVTLYDHNPKYNSWMNLNNVIKPGYYAKIKDGGHSTLFIKWKNLFNPNEKLVYFFAIGGNQGFNQQHGDVVGIRTYVLRRDTDANGSDLFWKATRHSQDQYGYQDGFGITW